MSAAEALLVVVTDDHGRRFCVRFDKVAAVVELAETRTSIYMLGGVDLQVEVPIDDVFDAINRCADAQSAMRAGQVTA